MGSVGTPGSVESAEGMDGTNPEDDYYAPDTSHRAVGIVLLTVAGLVLCLFALAIR